MPHLPYPAAHEIKPEAKEVLDAFEAAYGRPSHIFHNMSWNGRFARTASEAWHSLVVEPSNLERWVKEAIVVITCSTQQTQYCVEGHSNALRRQGLSDEQVRAVQGHTFDGFKDPELSIFRFAHKAAAAPKNLTREDYKILSDLGLSNETILEILGVVWVNTAMNMIVDALGVARTDDMKKELKVP
jgi:uncharacterized peroxidase-related enzyme